MANMEDIDVHPCWDKGVRITSVRYVIPYDK